MKNSITLLKAIAFCFMIIASSQLVAQIGIGVTGAVNSSAAGFLNMAFGIFKNGVLLPESVFLTTNSATATTGLYFIIHVTTPVVASDYFDLQVIGHDGAPTVTYLTFRNVHFSAVAY